MDKKQTQLQGISALYLLYSRQIICNEIETLKDNISFLLYIYLMVMKENPERCLNCVVFDSKRGRECGNHGNGISSNGDYVGDPRWSSQSSYENYLSRTSGGWQSSVSDEDFENMTSHNLEYDQNFIPPNKVFDILAAYGKNNLYAFLDSNLDMISDVPAGGGWYTDNFAYYSDFTERKWNGERVIFNSFAIDSNMNQQTFLESFTFKNNSKIANIKDYGLSYGIYFGEWGIDTGIFGISGGVKNDVDLKAFAEVSIFCFEYEFGYNNITKQSYDEFDFELELRLGPAYINWSLTDFTKDLWSNIGDVK